VLLLGLYLSGVIELEVRCRRCVTGKGVRKSGGGEALKTGTRWSGELMLRYGLGTVKDEGIVQTRRRV
jgi:hypothetical protein